MIGRAALGVVAGLLVAAASGAMTHGVALGTPTPGVAWHVSLVAQPTNLALTGHGVGEPRDQYVLVLTNTGSLPSSGTVALTVALPVGVTVGGEIQGPGWGCPRGRGIRVVTCFYSPAVAALSQSSVLTIPVAVTVAGTLTAEARVSGGGAATAVASRITQAGAPPPPFGFLDFGSQLSDLSGAADTQASDHPYALTATFDFPQREVEGFPERPVQILRAMRIDLPAGLLGNPQAAPRCSLVAVFAQSCPASSRVGAFLVNYSQGLFEGGGASPIYNVIPERGYPAEFAMYVEGINKTILMYASVRTGSDYGLRLSIPDIPAVAEARSAIVTFFGDPQGMDGSGNSSLAFLTNPSDCSPGLLTTHVEAQSWEEPGQWVKDETQAPLPSGCDLLWFQPAIAVTPGTALADEPTGYTIDLHVPQSLSTGPRGLATPDLRDVTVTLPQGTALSPAAADGLVGCPAEGAQGIALSSPQPGRCPLASQVGAAEAATPLLAEPLQGHVYLAQPGCGGSDEAACTQADALDGTLYGLYLELEGSGVIVKQHGTISASPTTGQLAVSFRNIPQLPLSDLKLTLADGPRAPLANPQDCAGQALLSARMTPWSSPQTGDADPSSAFALTGCEGLPFAPTLLAGTIDPAAGAYTSFSATVSRTDRMQDLGALQLRTPPGLLGMLSHVAPCAEPQAELGTCSAASRIGAATAGVGSGSHPYWISGPIYLTGPYRGAPFGLSMAIAAQAGPFNLGAVVVRAMLNIDPVTAALTISSDPLPRILDGIPLRLQKVNVTVDRPQFMFNPTSCAVGAVSGEIASTQGVAVSRVSRFAVGGCRNLPFDPGLEAITRAPGSKRNGTSLDVTVSQASGEANTAGIAVTLPKQLPSRLSTIQQACRRAAFAANPATCPAGSLIGIAKVLSPVLPTTLAGPAYLVSHGAAFPNIELILQGKGVRINLTGSLMVTHGVTSARFAGMPDAPITRFELKLPAGPHSALTTNGNLCAKPLVMPTAITGQNGRRIVRRSKVAVAGCPRSPRARA